MNVHYFKRKNGQDGYLLLDRDEKIIELPTRFALSYATKIGVRYSKYTVSEYIKVLKLFCAYLYQRNYNNTETIDDLIATMGSIVIEDWLKELADRGIALKTLQTRDAVLKIFMEWLTSHEAGRIREVKDHPYSDRKLKTASPGRSSPKYLTYQQVSNFIRDGIDDESQRCIAHFIYDTGVRVSEVARVRRADLPNIMHYPSWVMYFPLPIQGSKGPAGKSKKRHTIISRPMLERLLRLHNNWKLYIYAQAKYPPNEMPAFLNVLGKPITTSAIQKQIQIASNRLRKSGQLIDRISPHRFRHGTALSILQSELGKGYLEKLVLCKAVLGHNNIQTTECYTNVQVALIAQLSQYSSHNTFKERYYEAQYIYNQTFKKQISNKKRGKIKRISRHEEK